MSREGAPLLHVSSSTNSGTLEVVLRACGDISPRENVMKQVTSMKNVETDLLLPGILINTSQTDYRPIKQLQMMRLNGHADRARPLFDYCIGLIMPGGA